MVNLQAILVPVIGNSNLLQRVLERPLRICLEQFAEVVVSQGLLRVDALLWVVGEQELYQLDALGRLSLQESVDASSLFWREVDVHVRRLSGGYGDANSNFLKRSKTR